VLLDLGGQGSEMPRNEGPTILDSSGHWSKDDKMMLNCLEHVSCAEQCYYIDPFVKLIVASLLRL
jgi:hypothetical protein